MKRISLILPVYNCADYLEAMVSSILAQGWENLQVILSDDGSTDGSLELARSLAETHPEITLVSGENRGVSAARNRGLAVADGDYIGFCDGDDTLYPDYLATLAQLLEDSGGDVACCGFQRIYEAAGTEDRMPLREAPTFETDGDHFRQWLLRPDGYTTVMWNKLFRREVLLDANGALRRFDEQIHIVEDGVFIFGLPVKKAVFTTNALYRYVVRRTGAMYGRLNPRKLTELRAREEIVSLCCDGSETLQNLAKMKYQKGVRDLMLHGVIDGQGRDIRHLTPEMKRWRSTLYTSPFLSKKEKLKYLAYTVIIRLNLRRIGGFLMEKLSGH